MIELIHTDWKAHLSSLFQTDAIQLLFKKIEHAAHSQKVYPQRDFIFHALNLTPLSQTKVVILGQDPYHGEGQAQGLSFSVPQQLAKWPPSLRNIFKELMDDLNTPAPLFGDLRPWASQGVLLLNTCLTVQAGKAGSHSKWGWELVTDRIIELVSQEQKRVVFILWGNWAQKKRHLIDEQKHLIIASAHPSPLSAYNGFWNSKPFSKANEYLSLHQIKPIDWNLNNYL